jgi:hypothetical protein
MLCVVSDQRFLTLCVASSAPSELHAERRDAETQSVEEVRTDAERRYQRGAGTF